MVVSRNVTRLFQHYREEARLLHRGGHPAGARKITRTGDATSGWMSFHEALMKNVSDIQTCLKLLDAAQTKHLLPGFGETEQFQLEGDVEENTRRVTSLLQGCEKLVRMLYSEHRHYPRLEGLLRRNMQKRFAMQVQERSTSFREKQENYLRHRRGQNEALNAETRFGKRNKLRNGQDERMGFGHQIVATQTMSGDFAQNSVVERVAEIDKISKSVVEMTTIVKDIGALVIDQGTLLDRVDYNICETQVNTGRAVRELRIADRRYRRRHAFWCIMCLSIGCGLMLVLLVLKWTA